jgi:hypothetical protein
VVPGPSSSVFTLTNITNVASVCQNCTRAATTTLSSASATATFISETSPVPSTSTDSLQPQSSISPGAIAGIVVGVVVLILILAAVIKCIRSRRSAGGKSIESYNGIPELSSGTQLNELNGETVKVEIEGTRMVAEKDGVLLQRHAVEKSTDSDVPGRPHELPVP